VTLDDIIAAPSAYQALTADEVRECFDRYYDAKDSITVIVRPEAPKEEAK
jgi:hypothetical protein